MPEDKHPTRTYFRKSLRGDRLAVLGLIIGIFTVPFVWWAGLIIVTAALMWSRWSYVDWREVHTFEDRGFTRFLWEAFWDAHQYAAIPSTVDDPPSIDTESVTTDPSFNFVLFNGIAYPNVFELETARLRSGLYEWGSWPMYSKTTYTVDKDAFDRDWNKQTVAVDYDPVTGDIHFDADWPEVIE